MATFELRRVPYDFGDSGLLSDAIEVLIDGQPLLSLLWPDVDEPLDAPLMAGELFGPDGVLWLGAQPIESELVRNGRTAVLTCSCGVFGCGGVRARITLGADVVRWDGFLAIGGRAFDLSFEFDRAECEAALASV